MGSDGRSEVGGMSSYSGSQVSHLVLESPVPVVWVGNRTYALRQIKCLVANTLT
jgi:hypothetical protein